MQALVRLLPHPHPPAPRRPCRTEAPWRHGALVISSELPRDARVHRHGDPLSPLLVRQPHLARLPAHLNPASRHEDAWPLRLADRVNGPGGSLVYGQPRESYKPGVPLRSAAVLRAPGAVAVARAVGLTRPGRRGAIAVFGSCLVSSSGTAAVRPLLLARVAAGLVGLVGTAVVGRVHLRVAIGAATWVGRLRVIAVIVLAGVALRKSIPTNFGNRSRALASSSPRMG